MAKVTLASSAVSNNLSSDSIRVSVGVTGLVLRHW